MFPLTYENFLKRFNPQNLSFLLLFRFEVRSINMCHRQNLREERSNWRLLWQKKKRCRNFIFFRADTKIYKMRGKAEIRKKMTRRTRDEIVDIKTTGTEKKDANSFRKLQCLRLLLFVFLVSSPGLGQNL